MTLVGSPLYARSASASCRPARSQLAVRVGFFGHAQLTIWPPVGSPHGYPARGLHGHICALFLLLSEHDRHEDRPVWAAEDQRVLAVRDVAPAVPGEVVEGRWRGRWHRSCDRVRGWPWRSRGAGGRFRSASGVPMPPACPCRSWRGRGRSWRARAGPSLWGAGRQAWRADRDRDGRVVDPDRVDGLHGEHIGSRFRWGAGQRPVAV